MSALHCRCADVGGRRLFCLEAGPAGVLAAGLRHGFPASSFMFRDPIPPMGRRYHVIAPDHLGFGLSGAPPVSEFSDPFDALAGLTAQLLSQLEVTRYATYVQDYGAPIGWRLALAGPGAITAIITQNGNGYEAGLTEAFWQPAREHWRERTPQTEAGLRQALTLAAIRWQCLHSVPDETLASPETWLHDDAQISRPGNGLIQLALLADCAANLPRYPALHAWLCEHPVPVLAVWGRNDEIFGPAGALACAEDAPAAEICLLDGGHFLLESHLAAVAGIIRGFLGRMLLS